MTCDKKFADELISGNGYHPNCGEPAPDNPRATRIMEYTNIGGKIAYGVTFDHDNQEKYAAESSYIRNPHIYWEYAPTQIICIASSNQHADIPTETPDKCPHCANDTDDCEMGFGLAGGGYGTYEMCSECGRILSKQQEVEE